MPYSHGGYRNNASATSAIRGHARPADLPFVLAVSLFGYCVVYAWTFRFYGNSRLGHPVLGPEGTTIGAIFVFFLLSGALVLVFRGALVGLDS